MKKKINKLIKSYHKKYLHLGEGRTRTVFAIDEDWVVKIPLNEEGIDDQYYEEDRFTIHNHNGWYAKCYTKLVDDIPLLFMERVKPIEKYTTDLPGWVKYIDCQQVGYTADGRLVAYDFGFN